MFSCKLYMTCQHMFVKQCSASDLLFHHILWQCEYHQLGLKIYQMEVGAPSIKKLATNLSKNRLLLEYRIFYMLWSKYSNTGILKCFVILSQLTETLSSCLCTEKKKTPSQLWFLMWHLIQPLNGTVGCPPAAAPLPLPRPAPLRENHTGCMSKITWQ